MNLLFTNLWSWAKSKSQKNQSQSCLARGPRKVSLQTALPLILHLHLHAGARGTFNGMKMVKSPKVRLRAKQRHFTCVFRYSPLKCFFTKFVFPFWTPIWMLSKQRILIFLHDSAFGTLVHMYSLQHWNSWSFPEKHADRAHWGRDAVFFWLVTLSIIHF